MQAAVFRVVIAALVAEANYTSVGSGKRYAGIDHPDLAR